MAVVLNKDSLTVDLHNNDFHIDDLHNHDFFIDDLHSTYSCIADLHNTDSVVPPQGKYEPKQHALVPNPIPHATPQP